MLKTNKFFESISSKKLQKLEYYVKNIKMINGQVLYKEGDEISGIYLVVKGSMKYQKLTEYEIPIESKTHNKWLKS